MQKSIRERERDELGSRYSDGGGGVVGGVSAAVDDEIRRRDGGGGGLCHASVQERQAIFCSLYYFRPKNSLDNSIKHGRNIQHV
ncbi:hypothetical protein QYF36_014527 [Acer negundo]|nr:hypothetical protein QYF36_014527 [Acer negundo]